MTKKYKKLIDSFPLTKEQTDVLRDTIHTYGMDTQMSVAAEEMSELIKALSKIRRSPEEPNAYLHAIGDAVEEVADVQIMLIQLSIMFGDTGQVVEEMKAKIERQRERLEEYKRKAEEQRC